MTELTITRICHLFESKGDQRLEAASVTLLQHALQTAWLAEKAGARDSLICACLLHDLDHLLDEDSAHSPAGKYHAAHGQHGASSLSMLFDATVTDPIRLHVDAKRYLCYAHPGYADRLSAEAKRSLEKQGGVLTPDQARAFMREPHATEAVNLRLWDDQAHLAGLATPSLAHFAATLRTRVLPKRASQVHEARR
jgi:predicted HD phosphohydrolase